MLAFGRIDMPSPLGAVQNKSSGEMVLTDAGWLTNSRSQSWLRPKGPDPVPDLGRRQLPFFLGLRGSTNSKGKAQVFRDLEARMSGGQESVFQASSIAYHHGRRLIPRARRGVPSTTRLLIPRGCPRPVEAFERCGVWALRWGFPRAAF